MIARRVFVGLLFLLPCALFAPASVENSDVRPTYKSPLGLAIDPTGRFAYVALHTANTLAVVDLQKNCVQAEIPVGKKPYDVALDKGTAYVTCEADDTLVAVDVTACKVTRTFKVGQAPRGVSIDPYTKLIQVVCHDEKVLWKRNYYGYTWKEPIPPQPEGNFARAANLELVVKAQSPGQGITEAVYRQDPRPFNLFTRGQSIFGPEPVPPLNGPPGSQPVTAPPRTAFSPLLDLDFTRTSMDLVAHTRPRWFTATAHAAEGRVFTNAFSFFLNSSTSAAMVLLDEPGKGYPDPTDVVVKLPKKPKSAKPGLEPLKSATKPSNHPLKGSRVFISSGGADTVVVLDMDKAARHAEANGFGTMMQGGMGGGMMGGGMGGWNGGMMGGGMMSGYAGMMGGTMNGNMGGGMSGLPPGSRGLGLPAPNPGGRPPASPPAQPPGGMSGAGGSLGGMMQGGMQMGGMGGMMGWHGGFTAFPEDLRASAKYTLARLPTQANPRRMVLTPDGGTLVVSNHLADSLTLIDTDKLKVLRHINLGGPKPDAARRGEILFHSAKLTVQQQFSCASCHPNNGSDGLSWDTSPKPTGEHLNTRALHGVRDTGPFGWRGESETFQARIKNTMREVHKHDISVDAAYALADYLETIDPPRPLPQKPKDLPAIARGKALFLGKANCKSCHRGDAYNDSYPRAVILDHKQKWTPFDVPSLRGVARTAPYLHDGRAATLEEIFEQHNPHKRHGRAHELTRPELGDLLAFVRSL